MNEMEKDNTNRNSALPNSIEEDENLECNVLKILILMIANDVCAASDAETK